MRGYILIEGKRTVDDEVYLSVKALIDRFFTLKDDVWDCDDRNKMKWCIVNLRNGKCKELKGWKTPYTKNSEEETDTNWYTKEQIKKLEEKLR